MLNYRLEVTKVSDLLEFMTSEEMIIVGLIILTASILSLIVFLVEKTYYKRKQKSNTKLINQIVEEENKKEVIFSMNQVITTPIEKENEVKETVPVEALEVMDEKTESSQEETPLVIPIEEFNEEDAISTIEVENNQEYEENSIESIYNEVKEEVEQLQYTDPEPNQEEAKEELRKVTEELIKQEQEASNNNIDLTKFEEEQEENAIISLDELMQKSETLYQQNEVTQYQDEGNEPISLTDLEERMKNIQVEIEAINQEEEKQPAIVSEAIGTQTATVSEKQKIILDDLNTIKDSSNAYREDVVFKSSPIISPIFGIEESQNENNLELENTANYDKLDEEIRKTNKFLATLKELQKKLD